MMRILMRILMKKMKMGFIFIDSFVNEAKVDMKLSFKNQLLLN